MNKNNIFTLAVVAIVAIIGGIMIFGQRADQPARQNDAMLQGKPAEENGKAMMAEGYEGALIAGNKAPYLAFTQTDYEKAQAEEKVILLNFFANWCPTCRAELSELKDGFARLDTDRIVGFQVNWNDTETDAAEDALADEFGITYQHTKVILKDGEAVYGPEIESWTSEQVVKELNKYL